MIERFINRRTLRRAILFFGFWLVLFLFLASLDVLVVGWSDFVYFAPTKVPTGMVITLPIVIFLVRRVDVKLLARFEPTNKEENS